MKDKEFKLYVNGEQLIKGSFVKVVDLIKAAKRLYERNQHIGMCKCFRDTYICLADCTNLTDDEIDNIVRENIELFSFEIAAVRFGANGCSTFYWWSTSCTEIRIKYFDWLIEQYSKKD